MGREPPIGDDDLQAMIDGRLAPERRALVEAYLAAHPDEAEAVAADIALRTALRARLAAKAEEPIPARLRIASIVAERRRAMRQRLGAAAAACLLVLAGGGLGWVANDLARGGTSPPPAIASRDAIAAFRTYVVEKLHPVEVGADQEAHLVQWLSRRIGKPLAAPDLAAKGYALVGGRLLPTGGDGPAAMLMYADKAGNRLTLYVRADAADRATGFRFERQADVSAFSWTDRDLAFVVAGRAERGVLLDVAQAIYDQLDPARPDAS
jgi:anti-sigma factor RsiW